MQAHGFAVANPRCLLAAELDAAAEDAPNKPNEPKAAGCPDEAAAVCPNSGLAWLAAEAGCPKDDNGWLLAAPLEPNGKGADPKAGAG